DTVIRRYLLRTLAPHFRRDGRVLELGCYKGDMTAQILEYFPSLTAIEASSELAGIVRTRFGDKVEVVVSTFEEAQPTDTFDHVFLVHTLEHLDRPLEVLARIRDWLAPGGKLYVAVPNANALSRQIAVRMGLIEHNAAVTPAEARHGHRWTYSLDVLLGHLRRAGWHVEDHGGVIVKPLANYQFDQALAAGIISDDYVRACHELAKTYPDLSASLYAVCSRAP
ncbi:MAG: class I SAM-dependent methyltransferase, partial [Burkholderiales bacterium]|nr:class I SAM-dependent methyltransferase [Burkholderiales bacterium]